MNNYLRRGVSSSKQAIRKIVSSFNLSEPKFFEWEGFVAGLHSDTAGTKPILSYLYYKETGSIKPWKLIVKDVIAMNIDDLASYGLLDNYILSFVINRNPFFISDEIIKILIESIASEIEKLQKQGINIEFAGGETADVPDSVRILDLGASVFSQLPAKDFYFPDKPIAETTIIGVRSNDKTNSEIGTNGITNVRHEVLSEFYKNFPETYEKKIEPLAYRGKFRMSDKYKGKLVGDMLISPAYYYTPLLKWIIPEFKENIHKIIHCTGGGQTKVFHTTDENVKIIKNNLFPPNEFYSLMINETGLSLREILETLNSGHRLELYVSPNFSQKIVEKINSLGYNAKIIGEVKPNISKELIIKFNDKEEIWK